MKRHSSTRSETRPRWGSGALACLAAVAALVGGASGCFNTDNGPPAPGNSFYYPTGLAVSPGFQVLYVVNSDFDLQYTGGTVLALDLAALRTVVGNILPAFQSGLPEPVVNCGTLGPNLGPNATLYPGDCAPIDPNNPPGFPAGSSLIKSSVNMGAFATGALIGLRPQPTAATASGGAGGSGAASRPGARLFVPVRGDPSLTWFDITDDRIVDGQPLESAASTGFRLDCGQAEGTDNSCQDDHKAGINVDENTRDVTMPPEPYDLAIDEMSNSIITTHQTTGTVSLFTNGWGDQVATTSVSGCQETLPTAPSLQFLLQGLSTGVTGVATIPVPAVVGLFGFNYTPGYLITYNTAAEVDVVRYLDDCAAAPSRPYIERTLTTGIPSAASGVDSRGIAIDDAARKACEAACVTTSTTCACAAGDTSCSATCSANEENCLIGCAGVPLDVYIANRAPPSLQVAQTVTDVSQYGSNDALVFGVSIPLNTGPSRVKIGHVMGTDQKLHTRIFVLCFDSRQIFVVDPEDPLVPPAELQTGRGPTEIVFDDIGDDVLGSTPAGQHNFAYVAHFTDSYVGVLDLDMNRNTYLEFVATVGLPVAPRESN